MSRWVVRRLLASLLTLFGITTITFLLARVVPSDPAVVYIGPLARPAEIARVTKQLGLDRPLYSQYVDLPPRASSRETGEGRSRRRSRCSAGSRRGSRRRSS